MTQINWGLAGQTGGFQNALAQGMQLGATLRQQKDMREERNALSAYAANPTREGIAGVAQYNPEFAIQERGRFDQQDAQQAQRQQADAGTFRRLLQQAGQSPEGWQQAMGAAQQMGLNVANVPQQYDPAWAQQQLFIHDALSDPATATAVVNDVVAMGLDPETPEGRAAVQELTLYKYAKQTTDERGAPMLSLPTIAMPEQQAQAVPQGGGFAALPEQQGAPAPGAVEDGYRFRGGDPADPASWEQVGQQAPQMTVTPRELDALVRRFGPQEVQRRLDSGIVAVRN